MEKRYQVFVSSTFDDLREERRAVIEYLLNAKYIPAGMELFSASNDEQFEYIKKIIDTCDYYVLIVAARYGSINPSTGKSFTEQEYDYAVSKGIPILTFLHRDPYNLPSSKREDDKRERLEQFRSKTSGRLCKMWSDLTELTTSVVISLNEQVKENPQKGWIRNDSISDSNNNRLLSQMQQENLDLKKEIEHLNSVISELYSKLESSENIIPEFNKNNDKQLKETETVQKAYDLELNSVITAKIIIRFNKGANEGKVYTTWLEILIKMRDDLFNGCTFGNFHECINRNLIVGKGKVIYEDVRRIIRYMVFNSLWESNGNKVILTQKGIKILKRYGYYN